MLFYILDQCYEQCLENDLGGFLGAIFPELWEDATYDKVTHPEYFIALVYQVGTHLPEALVNSLFNGGLPKEYLNYKNENFTRNVFGCIKID